MELLGGIAPPKGAVRTQLPFSASAPAGLVGLCHVTLVREKLAQVRCVFQALLYLELLSQPPSVLLESEIQSLTTFRTSQLLAETK